MPGSRNRGHSESATISTGDSNHIVHAQVTIQPHLKVIETERFHNLLSDVFDDFEKPSFGKAFRGFATFLLGMSFSGIASWVNQNQPFNLEGLVRDNTLYLITGVVGILLFLCNFFYKSVRRVSIREKFIEKYMERCNNEIKGVPFVVTTSESLSDSSSSNV